MKQEIRIKEEADMSTGKEAVSSFYGQYDEDGRTVKPHHGVLPVTKE